MKEGYQPAPKGAEKQPKTKKEIARLFMEEKSGTSKLQKTPHLDGKMKGYKVSNRRWHK